MRDSASVHSNEATSTGGGVYAHGTFIMQGSVSVHSNEANQGGGVSVGEKFIMQDNASIYGNKADQGGGVMVYGGTKFYMSGGVIYDSREGEKSNKATDSDSIFCISSECYYGTFSGTKFTRKGNLYSTGTLKVVNGDFIY
jgi:predicted outer membrane repeat protein